MAADPAGGPARDASGYPEGVQVVDQDDGGRRRTAGGISLQTLIIASVASAVTSYVVSRVWGPGTLIGAAATPVIVALVAESLRKPVETVAATAQRVPVAQYVPVVRERVRVQADPDAPTRVAAAGAETPTRVAEGAGIGGDDAPTRVPGEPRPRDPADSLPPDGPTVDPGFVAALEAEAAAPPRRARRPVRWKLVLATAAAAFAIVVAVYTIPDLVAGKSITGSGRATTLFGGSSSGGPSKKQDVGAPSPTGTEPGKTVTTTAPATTTTVPAPTTTTTPPDTSTTAPPDTTTAPPDTTTTPPSTPTAPIIPPPTGTTAP